MRFSTLFTTLALAASLAAALPAGRLRAEDALCADPSAVCAAELSPACRRLGAGSVGVAGGTADCGGQLAAYRECLASAVERCPSAPATASGGGCSEAQADRAWEIAESRKTCGAYRAFVDACPSSPFTAFAAYEMRTLGCGDGADRAGGAAQAASQGSGAGPRGPFRDCPDCPEMIALPGGPATLGSPASEPGRNVNEGPLTEVRIRPFALSITEVTRGAFARFAAETGHDGARCYAHLGGGQFGWSDAASWRDPGYPQTDAHPAVCLSWSDAQAYIGWLNRKAPGGGYRLPSEAELEYAIRAGAATAYPWGADPNAACAFANGADLSALRQFPGWTVAQCEDGRAFTSPAGAYRANAFGLKDMIGSVYHWAADCWVDSHAGRPADGSPRLNGDCRSSPIRGGSWDNAPVALRSAFRAPYDRGHRGYFLGLRVAKDLP